MRSASLVLCLLFVFAVPVCSREVTGVGHPTVPVKGLPPQGKTDVKITRVEKQFIVVATRDGSLYEVPTTSILAYRRKSGKIELKLSNGMVLVVPTDAGGSDDTDWRVMRRTMTDPLPTKPTVSKAADSQNGDEVARKYRSIAIDAQQLLDKAGGGLELPDTPTA